MLNVYYMLADMAESLISARLRDAPPRYEEDPAPSAKKMPLTIPYGLDFATWLDQERRRLVRMENQPETL